MREKLKMLQEVAQWSQSKESFKYHTSQPGYSLVLRFFLEVTLIVSGNKCS